MQIQKIYPGVYEFAFGEGAILPILKNISSVFDGSQLKIKPVIYGEKAEGSLYIDDFTSFDFENGDYSIYKFKFENGRFTVNKETNGNIIYNYNNTDKTEILKENVI